MKKVIKVALASALLLASSFSLYSCAENKEKPLDSSHDTEKQTEIAETELPKRFLSVNTSRPEPDYETQLWNSDDVVLGEVVEELEAIPDPETEGVYSYGFITPYRFKVEKSYKGLIEEGDTITVHVWNFPETITEDGEVFAVVSDTKDFYLHEGQRGVFMLKHSDYLSDDKESGEFRVAYKEEGIFEPKESGIALINEDSAEVYASPSFEITLDQISADIERADEKFGDRDEAPVNGGGIFVDEGQSNEVE
ncbi:MAG: hypothetical protein HFE30_06320 [Clostridiales bacterium]|nr:hypothetical protein [Clostridiales bacterium]